MPLEGHWQRQNTPPREAAPRERRFFAIIAGLIAIAAIAVVIIAATSSTPKTPAGCIDVTSGGTMGAESYRACGEDARDRCAAVKASDAPVLKACRKAGLAAD